LRAASRPGPPANAGDSDFSPPRFAVIPAGASIAIPAFVPASTAAATATAAAVTTAAAAVSATAAAAIATTAAAIATTAPISSGTSFVDRQIAAVKILAIELLDSGRRFVRGRHLDKAKASRASRHAIFYDLSRFNISRLGKELAQIIAGRLEREISHVEFCSHFYLCPLMLRTLSFDVKEARNQSLNKGRNLTFFRRSALSRCSN
jgi:hypothetical protein